MEPGEIHAAWRQLLKAQSGRAASTSEMPSIETRTIVAAGKIRLAVRDSRYCSVLLPLAVSESGEADQISQVISVQPVILGCEGKAIRFLEIRCEEEALTEVFARVVSDILRRIELGSGVYRAVDEALREFRRLLQKWPGGAHDERTIAGLIGELLTLIEILTVHPGGLKGWHGPDSDRHDFRAGSVMIEVKTSLGADRSTIYINGMKQLESSDDTTLIIRHVCIEPDPAGSLLVPDLVTKAAALLSDPAELEEKLEAIGYMADSAERWAAKRYRHVGSSAYQVRDGFPRLVPAQLRVEWPIPGVSAVSYEVDLAAASAFRIDEAAWNGLLEQFCACL